MRLWLIVLYICNFPISEGDLVYANVNMIPSIGILFRAVVLFLMLEDMLLWS